MASFFDMFIWVFLAQLLTVGHKEVEAELDGVLLVGGHQMLYVLRVWTDRDENFGINKVKV